MNLRKRYLLAGLAVLFAGCAQLDTYTPPSDATAELEPTHMAFFKAADTNGSGFLEENEIRASIDGDFAQLDRTGDGAVTIDDIYGGQQAEAPGSTRNTDLSSHLPYDTNADNTITRAEHHAALLKIIAEMDTNNDGVISFAEYRAFRGF